MPKLSTNDSFQKLFLSLLLSLFRLNPPLAFKNRQLIITKPPKGSGEKCAENQRPNRTSSSSSTNNKKRTSIHRRDHRKTTTRERRGGKKSEPGHPFVFDPFFGVSRKIRHPKNQINTNRPTLNFPTHGRKAGSEKRN